MPFFLVFLCVSWLVVFSEFNHSVCPEYWELQTEEVKNNFSISSFVGTYYEIYLHDYWQYPGCAVDLKCIRTVKWFNQSIGEFGAIEEYFTLNCGPKGGVYPATFTDNCTEVGGYFLVTWDESSNSRLPNWVYDDTVVATSHTLTSEGQYEWVIELQCYYNGKFVEYIGINFYCYKPNPSEAMKNDMLNTALKQGLGPYMNQRIFIPANQTNCTYP